MDINELKQNGLFYVDNPKYRPDLKDIFFYVTGWKEAKGLDEENTYSVNLRKHKAKGLEGFEFEDNYSQFIEFLKPIPLTEEWLPNLGILHKESTVYELNEKGLSIVVVFYDRFIINIKNDELEINYEGYPMVHEFQNMVALFNKQ